MRNKFKYSVLIFSYGEKFPFEKKGDFSRLSTARKVKRYLLKSLERGYFVRIIKDLVPQKVFKQSTIYDFGA